MTDNSPVSFCLSEGTISKDKSSWFTTKFFSPFDKKSLTRESKDLFEFEIFLKNSLKESFTSSMEIFFLIGI